MESLSEDVLRITHMTSLASGLPIDLILGDCRVARVVTARHVNVFMIDGLRKKYNVGRKKICPHVNLKYDGYMWALNAAKGRLQIGDEQFADLHSKVVMRLNGLA